MFKIYSKGCEYAIRALSQIHPGKIDQKITAKWLCKKAGIPESYSRKILQALVRKNILSAVTGPNGGYVLAKQPAKIDLLAIVKAVDGQKAFDRCIMGLHKCSNTDPCPIHHKWTRIKNILIEQMEATSLESLIRITSKKSTHV